MSILVQKSGILSTIQDLGRKGFRQFGINPNGAMDASAARLINILLGNDETAAVLEIHFPAPKLLFEKSAVIALGGANFAAKVDNESIENWRPFFVGENQTLSFTEKVNGNRTYLAVKGGLKIKKWFGSASTNLLAEIGGFEGRSLRSDDRIELSSKFQVPRPKFSYKISNDLIPRYINFPTIRVVAGAEFEGLTALSERNFLKQSFTVSSDSDRMGFRLTGEPLYLLDKTELVSSAVGFGTIQLLPDGQLIVLMADSQTTGGYPRIAHVASFDLPILAQLGANDKVGFELVSLQEAENLIVQIGIELNYLKFGVKEKLREQL